MSSTAARIGSSQQGFLVENSATVASTTKNGRKKKLSPMLTQYIDYKERYPDCLLLFQVGDFYELFFDDAVTVAQTLNLTLTSRDKNSDEPIPMCGVPVAVVDNYVERLVDLGYSVAIVSQCSIPQPGKGMVDRKLDRIVTPAVRVTSGVEGVSTGAALASVVLESDDRFSLAFGEIESGTLRVCDALTYEQLAQELARIHPAEVLLPRTVGAKSLDRRTNWVNLLTQRLRTSAIKYRPEEYIQRSTASKRSLQAVTGYSALSPAAKRAVLLLVNYVDETTVDACISLREIVAGRGEGRVEIDAKSRQNLELLVNDKDRGEEGSLFHYLDRSVTVGGKKQLREWILAPLAKKEAIEVRQRAIGVLLQECQVREELRTALRQLTDLQRLATRIELGIVSPRELQILRLGVGEIPAVFQALASSSFESVRAALEPIGFGAEIAQSLFQLEQLLAAAISESAPLSVNDGGAIRPEYDEELARFCELRNSGGKWMLSLEQSERERTGISSLKVKFNNVLGYFIEVTKANLDKVPEEYQKRQSMTNAARFITPELKAREEEILSAKSKQIEREKQLFAELLTQLQPFLDAIRTTYRYISELDVFLGLARLAEDEALTCPVVEESCRIAIREGEHPVLRKALEGGFVPNSLEMEPNAKQMLILTGPNMGGKSTYLRQTALIVIMAQLGSFVPAKEAHIGIVDRIFARLGASDDMLEGESTFMVEMREAALITSSATERSLVLVDEIGRGTATADGLALAHSIVEWLATKVRCRTLFATHFHELTGLERTLPTVHNLSVGSVDRGGQVIFTHQICGGPASRSYGVEVARLAGLPEALLERAKELLTNGHRGLKPTSEQLDMFSGSTVRTEIREPADYQELVALREKVAEINPDELTPKQAHELLYSLREG